jgi:putative DNA modification/repair radical SAM protein
MGNVLKKLKILANAAKYDVSCSSSGIQRKNSGVIGNSAAAGICHSWSSDGRCISLLKILMSNDCIYNCSYCINRITSDISRATFEPNEIAKLTIEFYRRNYIEGLFLSSAVVKNPNYTMENMCRVLELLRHKFGFRGYIHVKAIPNADVELIIKAGYLADRMSMNIELPSEESLKLLAPQKNMKNLLQPMNQIGKQIICVNEEKSKYKIAPKFVPAGQSTQMMVGASNDSDYILLNASQKLYDEFNMKRVYYSAYIPVVEDKNLPALVSPPPLLREHRLYQADWLLRFYKFRAEELLNQDAQYFDLEFDPKISWAFTNINLFPIEINKASYELLLRIPGIGPVSAKRIIKQRKIALMSYEGLKKVGVVLKRAKYFITCSGKYYGGIEINPEFIKYKLGNMEKSRQLSFWS